MEAKRDSPARNAEIVITAGRGTGLLAELAVLWSYRELLRTLARRELQVRYKQAVLGAAWAVVQPVVMMVVFTVFFGRLARIPSDGIPYPIFAYSALLPWMFFASSLQFAMASLAGNASLLSKVYFPREVLPLSSVLATAADFGIAGLVFVGMMVFYRIELTANVLYLVPLVLIQVTFTIAISLVLSALNVYYRDVRHAIPLVIQLWMFATPIAYPLSIVPASWQTAYVLLNPMAGVIDGYRRTLVRGLPPDLVALTAAGVVSLVLLVACYWGFKRLEGALADAV